MIGIYKITNPKGKVYIGQSVNIGKRVKSYMRLDCRNQVRLYHSMLKYGFSAHIFEIIEQCTIEQLNTRERYWQDFYNVLQEGLNCRLTEGADKSGRLCKQSIKKKVANTDYKKMVSNTDYKKRTTNTDYRARTANTDWTKKVENTDYKTLSAKRAANTDYRARTKKLYKIVLQFSKDQTLIREWPSIAEAGESLQISKGNIVNCCKGLLKSSGGFVWRYK